MGNTKPFPRLEQALWAASALFCFSFCGLLAYKLGFFVDETVDNTAAALHFFRTGIYSSIRFSEPFDPALTSGLPLTWISGLVWTMKGNLFTQRLLLVAWHFLLFLVLVRKSWPLRWCEAFSSALLLWMAFIFWVPNWQTLFQNLAEVEGAILVAMALLLYRLRPLLAGTLLGIAVWGCKIVILPAALLVAVGIPALETLLEGRTFGSTVKLVLRMLAGLLLPLLAWLLYISLRTDLDTAISWPLRLFHFVTHQGSGGFNGERLGLSERLVSPLLEWVSLPNGMKARILLLLTAPIWAFLIWAAWGRISFRPEDERASFLRPKVFWAFFFVFSSLYGYWWFFLHPVMIYRHYQFALALSFFLSAYLVARVWVAHPWRAWFRIAALAGFALYFLKMNLQVAALPAPPSGFISVTCSGELITENCLEAYFPLAAPAVHKE